MKAYLISVLLWEFRKLLKKTRFLLRNFDLLVLKKYKISDTNFAQFLNDF